jgi:hypothetical protein
MKAPIICLAVILLIAQQSTSFAQVPRTITYQGIIQKDGNAFTGDGEFTFTLYKRATAVWNSQPMTIHVTGGLFSTVLGPFPDSIQFNGVDSLGVTFGGTELSPKIAFTSVAYSLYSLHAVFADSSKTPGPKGDPGQQGLQGLKGDSGAVGLRGLKGDKGDRGDSGAIGPRGLKGDKGDRGDSGVVGSQGLKGDKGDQGVQGSQGLKGDKGDSGAVGSQGLKGDKGDQGVQGSQGLKGDKGDRGDSGAIGPQGLKGDKGDKGDQGSQGTKGDPNPISSAVVTDGAIVFSLTSKTGNPTVQLKLVRTGIVGSLRLEVPAGVGLTAAYSALWYIGNGTGIVEAHYGSVVSGSTATFEVGNAHQFSVMVRVSDQWAKIDLFRETTTDINWYGFSTTN